MADAPIDPAIERAQAALAERIRAAHADGSPLAIGGHGSKHFYGNPAVGERLDTTMLSGVIAYDPRELVLTARAGTPLAEIETLLTAHGQMLPFEPPHFSGRGTLGGAIAAGLSGPRRAYAGAARDFVLGVSIIDGTGQPLSFGGQVIKNVAGYDVSRLMAGALGTLGVLTQVSLKVLPRPALETSLRFECDEAGAILAMNRWAGQPLPLSATSWHADVLTVRLSGAASAVAAAQARLGGETLGHGDDFWQRLRDHTAAFFDKFATDPNSGLWRLAVKSAAAPLGLSDPQWIEWGGSVRWLVTDAPAAVLRETAARHGGHATLFRGAALADGNLAPLKPALAALHRALKARFDPAAILNRGRLYPGF